MKTPADIPKGKTINITVDGYPVRISFSNEYNPDIAQQIKNALIDDFLRKNGLVTNRSVECKRLP